MATTDAPLVWDFYREVGSDVGVQLGGVVHYYDETSQTLFLNGGLKTRTADVEDGHWADSVLSSPSIFINEDPYTVLGLDHPSTGTLYGVATDGGSLTFLRYAYAMELSSIMESWSWETQIDNPIAQFSCEMMNIGPDIFMSEATLFQPGARITIGIQLGDSSIYDIGVVLLDECSYDISLPTTPMSGRNSIGFFLKDQTFDDNCEFTGISSDIMASILTYAGIIKMNIETGTGTFPFTFKPETSILEGIQKMLSAYTSSTHEWKLAELPDGTVCVGYADWLSTYLPNGVYTFNVGSDVFKRKTSKLVDSSYTKIRVTGKDSSDVDLLPVTVEVTNFPYWSLGAHRTKHLTAPDGFTQEELQIWAEGQAAAYQYIGIGEGFNSPFRPYLLVGDIAAIVENDEDEESTQLGLITQIRQIFSKSEGYKTEFSVDSGGVATDGENYIIYSRAAEVNGFNRSQNIVDLVRYISNK